MVTSLQRIQKSGSHSLLGTATKRAHASMLLAASAAGRVLTRLCHLAAVTARQRDD